MVKRARAHIRRGEFSRGFSKKAKSGKYWFSRGFSKKAQMKIQQMSFMIIGVFLFFGLVALFVISFKMSDIKQTAGNIREENALLLVSRLAESPEFSCGSSFNSYAGSCIDLDKVMALKNKIDFYREFWGISNIEIKKIYPESSRIVCENSNYPNCNEIQLISSENKGVGTSNFVALCRKQLIDDAVRNKCELGKLIITYELP